MDETMDIEGRAYAIDGGFTNRFFWEEVPDGSWAGAPCYIIGGGPSLERQWPWLRQKLATKLTIGINRVYEQFDPTIAFGMDPKFIRWIYMEKYGGPARKKWAESKAYKVWLCTYVCKLPPDIFILKTYKNYTASLRAFPFSMREGIGCGSNSGYAALNLAACLGANPIYLIGYDMRHHGDRTHWHDGHPEPQEAYKLDRWKRFFGIAAQVLHTKGFKVINLNLDSALDCFPKADLRAAFERKGLKLRPGHFKHIDLQQPFRTPTIITEKPRLPDIYIIGPYGFGDTFYLRAFVKHLAKRHSTVYVRTTLPEAFWDLINVKTIRPTANNLRAQQEHLEHIDRSEDFEWSKLPLGTQQKSWESFLPEWKHTGWSPDAQAFTTNPRGEESTTKYFENEYSIKDFDFSFPVKREWIEDAKKVISLLNTKGKKLCIVRSPTIRKEWACYSRNPKTDYFQLLVDSYGNDYHFVSLANLEGGKEWFTGKLRKINKRFDHGELPLTTIVALVKLADMVITGPDFFSLLAIAVRTKCFCIFGGCTKPSVIFDENMGLENLEYVAPDPFCNCMKMNHKCRKDIPYKKILQGFERLRQRPKFQRETSVGIPPGVGDMHWVLTMLESFKTKNCIDRLNVILNLGAGHDYSKEFLKLVPFVDSVESSRTRLPFRFSIIGGDGIPLQQSCDGADYIIEFNSRLEHGVKLKNILPEYKVNFDYPIDYPPETKRFAGVIKKETGGKLCLFYTSSVGGNKNWAQHTWTPEHWVELAELVRKETGCKPVLIGAAWDVDYANQIRKLDSRKAIHDLCNKTSLAQTFALIREANVMVSFLSGLVIIATRFKTPCASFWPTKELAPAWFDPKIFQRSWLPPKADEHGYMPFNYGDKNTTPQGILKAIKRYL